MKKSRKKSSMRSDRCLSMKETVISSQRFFTKFRLIESKLNLLDYILQIRLLHQFDREGDRERQKTIEFTAFRGEEWKSTKPGLELGLLKKRKRKRKRKGRNF